jgi:hypothetical protein
MSNQTTGVSVEIPNLTDPTDFLNGQIATLQGQADQLRPAVEAFDTLTGMIANLIAVRDGKPQGDTNTNRAGRGDRPEQFLTVLREAGDEGVKIADAARAMGMSGPNYLYRIAPELVEAGKIRKVEDRYFLITEPVTEGDESGTDEGDSDTGDNAGE